ncbi:MAG: Smr/MutS family protein [Proteobacteria bacterium]|nr:Smr/MutS family protein [Pseudomonadota bacterium]
MIDKNDGNQEDNALWRDAVRGAKPLPGKEKHADRRPRGKPLKPRGASADLPERRSAEPAARDVSAAPHGVDRRTDEKLRRGMMPIDRRLDLHGMTRDEAYAALRSAVTDSYETGARCMLVITGKGRDGGGILKSCLPEWLCDGSMGGIVLRVYPAQALHGGSGAFYVLVKRKR